MSVLCSSAVYIMGISSQVHEEVISMQIHLQVNRKKLTHKFRHTLNTLTFQSLKDLQLLQVDQKYLCTLEV